MVCFGVRLILCEKVFCKSIVNKLFINNVIGECLGKLSLLLNKNGKIMKNEVVIESGIKSIKCIKRKFLVIMLWICEKWNFINFCIVCICENGLIISINKIVLIVKYV